MRKIVSYLALTLCMTAPPIANGAFVIRLKNGNEYVTNRYWQEGAQVLFDADGGIFGVDKAFVNNIEKTDKVVKLVTTADHDPSDQTQQVATNSDKRAPAAETQAPVKRDENDPIMKEFNELKALSQTLNGMLTKKLQLEGKTNDYLAEFGEIHDMGDAAEAALKARR
jgi:hypothetical protein